MQKASLDMTTLLTEKQIGEQGDFKTQSGKKLGSQQLQLSL